MNKLFFDSLIRFTNVAFSPKKQQILCTPLGYKNKDDRCQSSLVLLLLSSYLETHYSKNYGKRRGHCKGNITTYRYSTVKFKLFYESVKYFTELAHINTGPRDLV